MPAFQNSYGERMEPGYPGFVANMETANSVSRIVEDAAGIGFGVAVFQGAAADGVTKTPNASFVGVTIGDKTLVIPAVGGTVDVYPKGSTAGLLDFGVILVTVATAVTAARTPAFVTPAGAWTVTPAGNTAVPGASFISLAAAGGLAKLRVR